MYIILKLKKVNGRKNHREMPKNNEIKVKAITETPIYETELIGLDDLV